MLLQSSLVYIKATTCAQRNVWLCAVRSFRRKLYRSHFPSVYVSLAHKSAIQASAAAAGEADRGNSEQGCVQR